MDDPNKGVPNDHNRVLVVPLSNTETKKCTSKEIKFVRPDSSVQDYRRSIGNINWCVMIGGMSSSSMLDLFQKMITDLVDIHFTLRGAQSACMIIPGSLRN